MDSMFSKVVIFGLSFLTLLAVQRYLEYRRLVQVIGAPSPSYITTLFSRVSVLGLLFPGGIPGIVSGRSSAWTGKFKEYNKAGWEATVHVNILPLGATISLVDPTVIREVTSSRARFPKPVQMYKVLSLFGDNIIASEGDEWKKYRKIAAPTFNDRNNKLIWDESKKIMLDLFDNVWGSRDEIVLDHARSITLPIALFVLSAAAFGRRISWEDEETIPPNHRMSFKDAIHEVTLNLMTKVVVPNWALGLTKRLRRVRLAFEELNMYMLEFIAERRIAEKKEERDDLLTNLLEASLDDPTFTDQDVTGNIFIFLFAGHETTAHTLCFTFALLALYQDEQELLFQQIKSVLADGRMPSYEQMPQFTRSMAVLNETLRLFTPGHTFTKYSAEDTRLVISNAAGGKHDFILPQGTPIMINTIGVHYNPRYWEDPEEFRPARFLDPDWPRDAFLPFGAGPRACIGRKFFETEAIAALTMIVLRYKIEIKEEPQFASETFSERSARVLASRIILTITPNRVPLVFKRR
ncbi:cytochrome P450 [Rhodocollybia butyracea]|uniref:Cytochrome P450 n=1 Tax=Rhodocollybia butyracea TaxID=206335 RepID=A0A9P5U0H7_9AGAR|nr:cytochrome P450 [Rhodocollybia butyracea]